MIRSQLSTQINALRSQNQSHLTNIKIQSPEKGKRVATVTHDEEIRVESIQK